MRETCEKLKSIVHIVANWTQVHCQCVYSATKRIIETKRNIQPTVLHWDLDWIQFSVIMLRMTNCHVSLLWRDQPIITQSARIFSRRKYSSNRKCPSNWYSTYSICFDTAANQRPGFLWHRHLSLADAWWYAVPGTRFRLSEIIKWDLVAIARHSWNQHSTLPVTSTTSPLVFAIVACDRKCTRRI